MFTIIHPRSTWESQGSNLCPCSPKGLGKQQQKVRKYRETNGTIIDANSNAIRDHRQVPERLCFSSSFNHCSLPQKQKFCFSDGDSRLGSLASKEKHQISYVLHMTQTADVGLYRSELDRLLTGTYQQPWSEKLLIFGCLTFGTPLSERVSARKPSSTIPNI
jgi:hypothetical protein